MSDTLFDSALVNVSFRIEGKMCTLNGDHLNLNMKTPMRLWA